MNPEDLNKSIAEINKTAQSLGQAQGVNFQALQPINSQALAPTPEVKIPDVPTNTSAEGLEGMVGAIVGQNKLIQEAEKKATEARTALTTEKQGLTDVFKRIVGVQESRPTLEAEAGITEKTQKANLLTNQIEQLDRAEELEIRAIQGRGDITKEAQAGLIFNVRGKYAPQKADLAIQQTAANRDLATAAALLEKKIETQLAPLQTTLSFTKMFYDENKDVLSTAEKRAFDLRVKALDDELETEKANRKAVSDLNLKLVEKGISPSSTLLNAKTQEEWLRNAAGLVGGADGVVEDTFIQSLLNTKGKKAITDTTIQKLDKGLTVLGQLDVLQKNIADVRTGPIVGAFRSANPWDTQAQTIKNQLNAIVPNLARGIYGEVGVLTDNDMLRYSQTIPTLKSTEEIRNAVLYITLDMIGKSIKNTLSVNAAAGRDVSGFVDIYTEMEATKNMILESIPGSQVPQAFQGQGTLTTGGTQDDPLGIKGLLGI